MQTSVVFFLVGFQCGQFHMIKINCKCVHICTLLYPFSVEIITYAYFCSFLHCAVDPSATFHQLALMAPSASGSGIHVPSSLGENHNKQHTIQLYLLTV